METLWLRINVRAVWEIFKELKKSSNWRLVYNYAFNQVEDFTTFLWFLRKIYNLLG